MGMREGLILYAWLKELVEGQVILDDGIALLDTTIIATRGKAWQACCLTYSCSQTMIEKIITR
jgi:hypothetical protein